MSGFSHARAVSTFCASLLALPLGACFDIEQVEVAEAAARPPSRLIDDFDDDVDNSVRQPVDPAFGPWRCHGYFSDLQDIRCDPAAGIDGTRGRVISFDLVDRADGERDYLFAELHTEAHEPVDLSIYERFVFSASFQPEPSWASAVISATCWLYCSALGTDAFVQSPALVALDASWYRYERDIALTFRQAQWQKDEWQQDHRPLLDPAACIRQVSGVAISVQPDMPDGSRATGRFVVDSIYVE